MAQRQDDPGPENFEQAVGLVSTREQYDRVSSPLLLDFATELVNRFPNVVLQYIADQMNVSLETTQL